MKKSKRVPSLTLHKPSGQARVRINKKDYYLGPYGSPESHVRYAELLKDIAETTSAAEILTNLPVTATTATVNDAILRFSDKLTQ